MGGEKMGWKMGWKMGREERRGDEMRGDGTLLDALEVGSGDGDEVLPESVSLDGLVGRHVLVGRRVGKVTHLPDGMGWDGRSGQVRVGS
jgi:hypothetical protein